MCIDIHHIQLCAFVCEYMLDWSYLFHYGVHCRQGFWRAMVTHAPPHPGSSEQACGRTGNSLLPAKLQREPLSWSNPYTQSGKSVHRLFENKSQSDAAHSGSHRSQCKIMKIGMGRCAPAIIYFISCSVFFMACGRCTYAVIGLGCFEWFCWKTQWDASFTTTTSPNFKRGKPNTIQFPMELTH